VKPAVCATCPFWHNTFSEPDPPSWRIGQCRRHAPTAAQADNAATWPNTEAEDWCGEHPERKP
jgi:hypothetical protein